MIAGLKKITKILMCTILITCSCNFVSNTVHVKANDDVSAKDVIKKYEKEIIASCRKTGVFPSITLGQMVYESGDPMSGLAVKHNNFFGIKWAKKFEKMYPGSYPVNLNTTEAGVATTGNFTHFPNASDGITEHTRIWWNGMYENDVIPVLYDTSSTARDMAMAIGKSRYSTTQGYGEYLWSIIKSRGFEKYDKIAFPEGRKLVGYGDRIKGEYNYPDDGYNASDIKDIAGGTTNTSNGNYFVITAEKDLVGMYPESYYGEFSDEFELPDLDSLSTAEKVNMIKVREFIQERNSWSVYDTLRVFTVFIGLVILVYAVFFGASYLFDRMNSLIEISLISILTLGRLRCAYDSLDEGKDVVTGRRVFKIEVVLLLVGFFLVAGGVFSVLVDIMFFMNNING